MKSIPLPPSLQKIVEGIQQADALTPVVAKSIVVGAAVKPEDLTPWADFDHPPTDSYGRKLVYDGGFFEIMVMSWRPGDVSAIHDHGYTQWGAVQVFGPAEHAVFLVEPESITTVSRNRLSPGRVLAVNHELVHQMGNPGDSEFLTLHLYGSPTRTASVTADARVIDLSRQEIQYTDGGVFYALPPEAIKRREPSAPPGFSTWLFDIVQRLRRELAGGGELSETIGRLTDRSNWPVLKGELLENTDENGHIIDSRYWKMLLENLRAAATIQQEVIDLYQAGDQEADPWRTYARLYDHVIGTTNSYIPRYLGKVLSHFEIDPTAVSFLDIGCGTGWLQEELVRRFHVNRAAILGVDPSQAMLELAQERSPVAQAALPELDIQGGPFDIVFCNSYQYMRHEDLQQAIRRVLDLTKVGGLCISEFITQDHIRWYPNVVFSEGDMVVSLRNPSLHERGGFTYQHSEIFNISRLGPLRVTHEGVHKRFLVSPGRLYKLFQQHSPGSISLFDAHTFEPLSPGIETCPSTRFVICVRREA